MRPGMVGCLAAAVLAWVPASAAASEHPEPLWAATVWLSWGTDGEIEEIPTVTSDFEDTWLTGVSLARQFARTGAFTWELEAGLYKHFGWQTHWEGDLSVGVRWDGFSWSDNLNSGVAIATGVSYASQMPAMEVAVNSDSKKWLQFMAIEIDFTHAERPDLALVARLHHRSSVWGLYGTEHGGSNFYGLGLRRRF